MKYMGYLIVLIVLAVSQTTFADARQHFYAGQDYYNQGSYQKAIEEFNEAFRLDPKPLLLYNIAMAYERMGSLEKAVDYLKRYLEADPENEERTVLLSKVASLEERIANTGIKLTANQAEATVYIDGRDLGKTPIVGVIPLSSGAHKIQVSKEGFQDFKINVAISSGQTTPVEVVLEEGQAGPAPSEEGETGLDEQEEEGDDGKAKALDVVPWVVAGVGAVTVGVGWGVLGTLAKNKQPSDPDADPTKQNEAHDMALVADIVGAAGAAVAVAGLVWGIVHVAKKKKERPEEDETAVSVLPVVGEQFAGVNAFVQF